VVEALLSTAIEGRASLVRRLELLGAIGRRVDTLFQLRARAFRASPNGGGAPALLRRRRLRSLLVDAHALWAHVVLPTLRERDIAVDGWTDLRREDRQILTRLFSTEVSPLLTPLTVDAAHPLIMQLRFCKSC
jgi:polyphosphate kinase